VQIGLATLSVSQKSGFENVDERFKAVNGRFDKIDKRLEQADRRLKSTGEEIVDLVARVHDELTKRVIDIETPMPGGEGSGGMGSGGSGVPLAS
jgi:DNA anti-recombination protein RmuC